MKHPRNYYYYWKEMTQIFATLNEEQIKDQVKDSKFYIEVSIESMRKAFPKIDAKFKELENKAKQLEEAKKLKAEKARLAAIEKAKALLKEEGEL
jgi:DNA-binding transcriptional regulator GbsR (MarR family)